MKILQVISSLGYGGAAKQLGLLALSLPRERFDTRVCVIGSAGPFGDALHRAGVKLEVLGCQRGLDLTAAWRLRALLKTFAPDVIHVWQSVSPWVLGLLCWSGSQRLFISYPCVRGKAAVHNHWFLRRASRVLAGSSAEMDLCRSGGLPSGKLIQVRPAVAAEELAGTPGTVSIPAIVCVGPRDRHKGHRDAIWTFDILRCVESGLRLVMVGDGADRRQIEQFARVTRTRDISLPGALPDVRSWLKQADVVWVPSLAPGGANVALEAMALAKPVIATNVAGMNEIVVNDETGFVIAPGDKVALARRTRQLLKDPQRRQRLGEAGRRRSAELFSVAALVERMTALYEAGS